MNMETLLKNETIAEYLSNYNEDKWFEVIESLIEYGIAMLIKQNKNDQNKDTHKKTSNKQQEGNSNNQRQQNQSQQQHHNQFQHQHQQQIGQDFRKTNETFESNAPNYKSKSNQNQFEWQTQQSLLQRKAQQMDMLMNKSLDKIAKCSQYRKSRAQNGIDEKLDRLEKKLDDIPTIIKTQRAPFDYY